jgi:hypothetical protein
MTIVVYHPAKGSLTASETKVAADGTAGDQRALPGHYFSCDECGWCGPIRTGERSRLAACEDARKHDVAKSMAVTTWDAHS